MRTLARLINASVPVLNRFRRPKPWPYTLQQMRAYAPGTLGAEVAAFLDARHFDLLPKYESHDVVHTLLGYGTTTTGELRLQTFMLGNRSASVAGRVLLLLGVVTLPELWMTLWHDFQRGRQAHPLGRGDLVASLNQPIEAVRQRFKVA